MAQQTQIRFEVGDRVYLVQHPTYTGTITAVYPLDWVDVRFDGDGFVMWFDASELDYWTRPESAEVR